jgi:hypothetical protein
MNRRLIRTLTATCVVVVAATVGSIATATDEAQAASTPLQSSTSLLNPGQSVSAFLFTNLAGGVLSAAAGTGFGEVLSLLGADPTASKLAEINNKLDGLGKKLDAIGDKLDTVNTKLNSLSSDVSKLTTSVSVARLTAVVNTVKPIVSTIHEDTRVLRGLAKGDYQDQYLEVKRKQVISSVEKLMDEGALGTLNDALVAARGGDDLLTVAFLAEYEKAPRFYTNVQWERAKTMVDYYVDEAATLTMLYAEKEFSVVTPAYGTAAKQSVRNEVTGLVDRENTFLSEVRRSLPQSSGGAWSLDKVSLNGQYILWKDSGRPAAAGLNGGDMYQTPSLADWKHLVSGQGSVSTAVYLKGLGFTPTVGCTQSNGNPVLAYWTSDIQVVESPKTAHGFSIAYYPKWINLATGAEGDSHSNPVPACVNIVRSSYNAQEASLYYTPLAEPLPLPAPATAPKVDPRPIPPKQLIRCGRTMVPAGTC